MTLVEMLSLIAVIALAFLIASRWTLTNRLNAHKSQCLNNLRQLSMAAIGYEHSFGRFPPGMTWSVAPGQVSRESSLVTGAGAFVAVLPYIDHANAYHAVNFTIPIHTPQNTTVCGWRIDQMQCPADTAFEPALLDGRLLTGGVPGGSHLVRKSNYAFVAGPWVVNTWKIPGVGVGERSSFPEIVRNQLGLFNVHSQIKLADVLDGSSNTLMLGERTLRALPEASRRDAFWWFSGNHGDSLMTTMFPPVAPDSGYPAAVSALAPSSQHEGAIQFAFADGSVRSFEIDPTEATKMRPKPVPHQLLPHLQGYMTADVEARSVGPDPFWDTTFALRPNARMTLLQKLSTRAGGESVNFSDSP